MDDRSVANLQEGIDLIDDVTQCLAGLRIRLWKALSIELVLQPDAKREESPRPVVTVGKGDKPTGKLLQVVQNTR